MIHIQFLVSEGDPVRVTSVEVAGFPPGLTQDSLEVIHRLNTVVNGLLVARGGIDLDQVALTAHLQNNGFAFCEVSAKVTVKMDALQSKVVFQVRPGPLCVFGEVRSEGNLKVADDVIPRGLTFSEGDLFQRKKFLSSNEIDSHWVFFGTGNGNGNRVDFG